MKWFKHMADASEDSSVSKIEAAYGLEGYARYWKILEKVASQMHEPGQYSAEYPWQKWCQYLSTVAPKLRVYLADVQLWCNFEITSNGKMLKIGVPKLLKIKDNYQKDLEVTSKQLPSNLLPIKNREQTAEREKESLTTVAINKSLGTPHVVSSTKTASVPERILSRIVCSVKNPGGKPYSEEEIVVLLQSYGVRRSQVLDWIGNYGLERVTQALQECGGSSTMIKNPGGWIDTALKKRWGFADKQSVSTDDRERKDAIMAIPEEYRARLRMEARKALGTFASASEALVEAKMLAAWGIIEKDLKLKIPP